MCNPGVIVIEEKIHCITVPEGYPPVTLQSPDLEHLSMAHRSTGICGRGHKISERCVKKSL